ncbi:hypothetical protein AB0K48_30385 [Nonomuraea sp. NPDC055795]
MTVGQSATHDVVIGADEVIKRFRSWERGEPQREWTALTLLAEHAPGLAPRRCVPSCTPIRQRWRLAMSFAASAQTSNRRLCWLPR